MNKPLLPSGLFDLLPPHAEAESLLVSTLLSHFRSCGYEQVSPPLMEYEDTLINQRDKHLSTQSFRVMDPLSQKMMAVRADMTMQIARIAGSLLFEAPRPLRLCYMGQTLRTTPEPTRSTRQFRQIGIEMLGCNDVLADVEVMQTAVTGAHALGMKNLSVDVNLSSLFDHLTSHMEPDQREALRESLRRKDIAAIEAFGQEDLTMLAKTIGPAKTALETLSQHPFRADVKRSIETLATTCHLLQERLSGSISITIDPLEMKGFGYYTGLSFSVFLTDESVEVGRGGRYRTEYGEDATGFTLYIEDLLSVIASGGDKPRLLVPSDTSEDKARHWRQQGYVVIYALTDDTKGEARRLNCSHRIHNSTIINTKE